VGGGVILFPFFCFLLGDKFSQLSDKNRRKGLFFHKISFKKKKKPNFWGKILSHFNRVFSLQAVFFNLLDNFVEICGCLMLNISYDAC
jgi:hypothetical protein